MSALPPWTRLAVLTFLFGSAHPVSLAADDQLLPEVPAPLRATLFAREPLVRNPCAMAFDARGRLFVGHGPQYRRPKPDTPPDSVVILIDTDGDGIADTTKTFATGLNCIQGMAWHGRDLWIANSPDLTIVRDLDGDDEADEYIRVYTDLGNIEHAAHGLNWAPDGKLYFTTGTSKGLTQPPERLAPKPFRDLWGVSTPEDTPEIAPPKIYKKGEYKSTYQDPNDNWGREGGVLRCDDLGANLEIVSRGTRNAWDISFDHEFNWLGTDNDQNDGDRVIMPFFGAHFGWGHAWSAHWTGIDHLPTAPISGPTFEGSGTGIVYYDAAQLPPEYRGVWFINDWLRKTTFTYRPQWRGALLLPENNRLGPFLSGKSALFNPVDIATGPDGTLYLTGWGKAYGAIFSNGQQVNEGRVFRIDWPDGPKIAWDSPKRQRPLFEWSFAELLEDLSGTLPVWRVDAQDELVRRGPAVVAELCAALSAGTLPTATETWALWTLGRMPVTDKGIDRWLAATGRTLSPNAAIQALRIAGHRARQPGAPALLSFVEDALRHPESRVRFAAIQSIEQARAQNLLPAILSLLDTETDRLCYYAAWHTLRAFASEASLRALLSDPRAGVRRGALLALLESDHLDRPTVNALMADADDSVAEIAALWIAKLSGNPLLIINEPSREFDDEIYVEIVAGLKPAALRATTDGTAPTPPEPTRRVRDVLEFRFKESTHLKVAIFINAGSEEKPAYSQIGPTVEARWIKRDSRPEIQVELTPQAEATTTEQVLPLLTHADLARGQALFKAAGCMLCHRVKGEGHQVGPSLDAMGDKANPQHLIESLIAPNASITEGFALQNVTLDGGETHSGIFREESNRTLTLVQAGGGAVMIEKTKIVSRESLHSSLMPPFNHVYSPQQMADVVAWLLAQSSQENN